MDEVPADPPVTVRPPAPSNISSPTRPATKKAERPPEPPPATKCADCGRAFKGYAETRWDVHVGGGVYKTVCTACFEKADAKWPDPEPKGKGATTSKKKR